MRKSQWLSLLVLALLLPTRAFSEGLPEKLQKAEDLLAAGQPLAAYEALDETVAAFWKRSPMFVRKALFVREVSGYGLYKEHAPSFKPDEAQVVYLEPVGFGYSQQADGSSRADWSVDYSLENKSGAVLIRENDFFDPGLTLGRNNREVHLILTVNVTGLKAGSYLSHFTLKDKHSDKVARFELPFNVTE